MAFVSSMAEFLPIAFSSTRSTLGLSWFLSRCPPLPRPPLPRPRCSKPPPRPPLSGLDSLVEAAPPPPQRLLSSGAGSVCQGRPLPLLPAWKLPPHSPGLGSCPGGGNDMSSTSGSLFSAAGGTVSFSHSSFQLPMTSWSSLGGGGARVSGWKPGGEESPPTGRGLGPGGSENDPGGGDWVGGACCQLAGG